MADYLWERSKVDGKIEFHARPSGQWPEILLVCFMWLATAFVTLLLRLMAGLTPCEAPSGSWVCTEHGRWIGMWGVPLAAGALGVFATVNLGSKDRMFRFWAIAIWGMSLAAMLVMMSETST